MELYNDDRNIEQSVSIDWLEHELATHGLACRLVIVDRKTIKNDQKMKILEEPSINVYLALEISIL